MEEKEKKMMITWFDMSVLRPITRHGYLRAEEEKEEEEEEEDEEDKLNPFIEDRSNTKALGILTLSHNDRGGDKSA